MVSNVIQQYLPAHWTNMRYCYEDYELVELPPHSTEYRTLSSRVNGTFNLGTHKIARVQNPYLYTQFLLKKEEYATRGHVNVCELYHDTAEHKIDSIISGNLDWRLASRVKYGKGVSFSPSPSYANQESSRANGTDRAMVVADVLLGKLEIVSGCKELPTNGYDTTIGNCGQVYVKYYDNEFYPKFIVYYKSRLPRVNRRRYYK
ncbi:hypothetical protein ILUMI_05138 [Ignelater luminosus]|uniref:Poly [ADP-ribose] polymerase n=1 Tax=Ignelater luminosus TaxID=2038154 RepID=A0A8K0DCK1_IGNLU|nr:hypothetical protein ILUMI_05138 [Ignelater luminosus]